MFRYIQGDTANEMWSSAYKLVREADIVEGRNGNVREVIHAALSLNNPIQKWVSVKAPPISIGYALAELIWILSGSDDANVINYWNKALPNYAGDYPYYPGAYGNRIFYKHGINQLDKVYETLCNHPESRQAVMLIWDPKLDLPYCNGEPNNKDIPCNICSMIKVRNGKLEWTQIMRSNDLELGLPYNLVQFTSIQEILASWLNVDVGSYNHISDSLHIYESRANTLKLSEIEVNNSDSLNISKNDFSRVIDLIYKDMIYISKNQDTVTDDELVNIANNKTGYESYDNILKVICAYAANKQRKYNVSDCIIGTCTNKAYITLWTNWCNRIYRR